jgi:hypothetical protein
MEWVELINVTQVREQWRILLNWERLMELQKRRGIFWVAEGLLTSQEGFCSKLVSQLLS